MTKTSWNSKIDKLTQLGVVYKCIAESEEEHEQTM